MSIVTFHERIMKVIAVHEIQLETTRLQHVRVILSMEGTSRVHFWTVGL